MSETAPIYGTAPAKLTRRVTALTVVPEGEPLYSERAMEVEIVDDAGREYVVITQSTRRDQQLRLEVGPEEWPALRAAVDRMIRECREAG